MRKFIAIATIAILTLASCNKRVPQIAILSDNAFVDGSATITLLLSSSSSTDVTVGLRYVETSSSASKALPGSALSYTNPVTISAGSTSAKIKVNLDEEGLADGNYHATLCLNYVQGAEISRTNQTTIYVKIGSGDVPVTDLTFMSSWSVALDGNPYTYEGKDYIDLVATVPGIKYFWVEANTDAELEQYYGGSVAGLISKFSSNISGKVAQGQAIGDLCWNASEAGAIYAYYWGPGETNFYIMEFDSTGKATGRYGKTRATLPPMGEEDYFDGLTLVDRSETWTITYAGVQSYTFPDSSTDNCEWFTVAGTGSVPFSFILEDDGLINTEADIRSYMRNDFNSYYAADVESGKTASELYYTAPGTWCSLYSARQGKYDAYLIAYDSETCYPSGEYAHIKFTDTAGAASSIAKASKPFSYRLPLSRSRSISNRKLLESTR